MNEFAESTRFPVIVKAAASWLNPKLKVSIVHSERDLVDVWHRAESSQNPNLLFQEYIPHGQSAGVGQQSKPDQAMPIPQYGLWSPCSRS